MVLIRTGFVLFGYQPLFDLLGAGVLGDSLGALRDGVFGQFTRQQKPDGGLDLPGGDGGPLVVVGQSGSLGSDTFEDIVDEGVHDAHGLGGDASVGVDLLQHLVNVDGVGLLPLLGLGSFLASSLLGLGGVDVGLARLLDRLANGSSFGRHLT